MFLKKFCLFLFERQCKRETDTHRDILIAGSFPKCLYQPGMSQANVNKEHGTQPRSSTWVAGIQLLESHQLLPHRAHTSILIWAAQGVSCRCTQCLSILNALYLTALNFQLRNLTCCATGLEQLLLLKAIYCSSSSPHLNFSLQ